MDHHRNFKTNFGVSKGDWGIDLHELAMRVIDHAACYDALDVGNITCIEDVMRQAQLVEHAYGQLEVQSNQNHNKKDKGAGKGKQFF